MRVFWNVTEICIGCGCRTRDWHSSRLCGALFTYDLTDNGTSVFTTNGSGYNYGLRLDGYKGDGVDPQMIFSFSTASGGSGATQQYDDVSGVVQISGQMRRSLANDGFGDV